MQGEVETPAKAGQDQRGVVNLHNNPHLVLGKTVLSNPKEAN